MKDSKRLFAVLAAAALVAAALSYFAKDALLPPAAPRPAPPSREGRGARGIPHRPRARRSAPRPRVEDGQGADPAFLGHVVPAVPGGDARAREVRRRHEGRRERRVPRGLDGRRLEDRGRVAERAQDLGPARRPGPPRGHRAPLRDGPATPRRISSRRRARSSSTSSGPMDWSSPKFRAFEAEFSRASAAQKIN